MAICQIHPPMAMDFPNNNLSSQKTFSSLTLQSLFVLGGNSDNNLGRTNPTHWSPTNPPPCDEGDNTGSVKLTQSTWVRLYVLLSKLNGSFLNDGIVSDTIIGEIWHKLGTIEVEPNQKWRICADTKSAPILSQIVIVIHNIPRDEKLTFDLFHNSFVHPGRATLFLRTRNSFNNIFKIYWDIFFNIF